MKKTQNTIQVYEPVAGKVSKPKGIIKQEKSGKVIYIPSREYEAFKKKYS